MWRGPVFEIVEHPEDPVDVAVLVVETVERAGEPHRVARIVALVELLPTRTGRDRAVEGEPGQFDARLGACTLRSGLTFGCTTYILRYGPNRRRVRLGWREPGEMSEARCLDSGNRKPFPWPDRRVPGPEALRPRGAVQSDRPCCGRPRGADRLHIADA
jgi:hypothetical protein